MGLVTAEGDVICHSMKELNQHREMLYWNYREMLKVLREDVNKYLPRILAKRKAVAVRNHTVVISVGRKQSSEI